MAKYLVLYRADVSAQDQIAQATPEQAQAGMEAWTAWASKAGDAIVDLGTPLSPVGSADATLGGYSVLQADSADALAVVLRRPPTPVDRHDRRPRVPGGGCERTDPSGRRDRHLDAVGRAEVYCRGVLLAVERVALLRHVDLFAQTPGRVLAGSPACSRRPSTPRARC